MYGDRLIQQDHLARSVSVSPPSDLLRPVSAVSRSYPNWGRSAIETRDPDGPHQHARAAREADVLSGVMFSGASDRPSTYGGEWADVHVPLRPGIEAEEPGEPTSVMTADHVRSTLAAAGTDLIFDGVKVSMRPLDRPNRERIALVSAVLAAMGPERDVPHPGTAAWGASCGAG